MQRESDEGFTLLDTLMSMVIMTVVMAAFSSAVLFMYRSANAVDAKSVSQVQSAQALTRLDKELHYAKGISREYGGGKYVDFLTVRNGQQQCVQLRVSGGLLSQRTWTYLRTPIDLTGWTTLASGVTDNGTQPFTYIGPADNPSPSWAMGFQQLKVSLQIGAGSSKELNTVTFAALNSSRTSGNDYCAAARTL